MSRIRLPDETYRLEEVNIPESLAPQLAGQMVAIEIVPEEFPGTRRAEPGELPALIAPDGTTWNAYRPARMSFRDSEGHKWNIPRYWQDGLQDFVEPAVETSSQVFHECKFQETIHLPSAWDLMDINVRPGEAGKAGGHATQVMVHMKPNQMAQVYWQDSSKQVWRVPHDWRRRHIRLPCAEVLVSQGIPERVAEAFSGAEVSVNYHPGSLCCLRDAYRFRDETGRRWPVQMRHCSTLGFGDGKTGLF